MSEHPGRLPDLPDLEPDALDQWGLDQDILAVAALEEHSGDAGQLHHVQLLGRAARRLDAATRGNVVPRVAGLDAVLAGLTPTD